MVYQYFTDNPNAMLADTQIALNKKFNKPKSKAQSVIEFKEIRQKIDETPWDFDQRLKCLIRQANMVITQRLVYSVTLATFKSTSVTVEDRNASESLGDLDEAGCLAYT